MKQRRICVVTGGRAEYGLLRWLMASIRDARPFELQIVATAAHLSPEFGLTFREIEKDGFDIDERLEILLSSDTAVGTAKAMGLGIIGFADAFQRLRPDLLVILGDRFEILSAVSAALVARIPVAHLHGGEVTEGAVDDAIRHSITKMAHLHFVAAEEYRQRVIQLGEHPDRVFVVGALGLDNIARLELLERSDLEAALQLKFGEKNLLVTYHPVTRDGPESLAQMAEMLAALEDLTDTQLIFTMPNADAGGRALAEMVKQFVTTHENARVFTSLGQLTYLSCMSEVDGVIGNSSSGLIEAPALRKGTINIGERQLGRLKASSVIDCPPDRASIATALNRLYSVDFRARLASVLNPYGEPGAAERITNVLRECSFDSLLKKKFVDLSVSPSLGL